MALEKSDLKAIEEIINSRLTETESHFKDYVDSSNAKLELGLKDYVGFVVEKTEIKLSEQIQQTEEKLGKEIAVIKDDVADIKRNVNDLIETDQEFLKYFDRHEKRIVRLERKLQIAETI